MRNLWRFQFETWYTWLRRGHHPKYNFWVELAQWGLHPNRWKHFSLLWLFCCPVFFLVHAPRSNCRTDFYAKWLKRRVSAQGQSFWGFGRWVISYGENENTSQKLPPKRAWIGSFKPKRQNLYIAISRTINPTNKRFEDRVQSSDDERHFVSK